MQDHDPFAARVLSSASAALGAAAAELLLERGGEGSAPHATAFESWREHLSDRVRQLAAAVAVGRPGLFHDQVAWARVAFAARGMSTDELRRSLECLRDAIDAEAPDAAAAAARACLDPAIRSFSRPPAHPPSVLNASAEHGRVGAEYLLAVLEGDRRRAGRAVLDAVRAGMPAREAYLGVLAPVQQELGRMWHMNEISVAEEHFATTTTRAVLAQLQPLLETRPPNGKTAVIAAVEGNAHDLGLQMVADFLEEDGWRAIFLGASVPPGDIARAAEIFRADLAALGVNLAMHLGALGATIRAIRASGASAAKTLVGGFVFRQDPGLWRELGADGAAGDAEEAVREARRLCGLGG